MRTSLLAVCAALLAPLAAAQVHLPRVDIYPAIGFNDWTGWSMDGVGDVNGDGFADLLVGIPGFDEKSNQSYGRARLHFGGNPPGGSFLNLVPGPFSGADYGRVVAGLGDVNGDGHPDFAIVGRSPSDLAKVEVHFGGPGLDAYADLYIDTGTVSGGLDPLFGTAVAGGDVNGDGVSDILITSPGHDNGMTVFGAVFVYYGRAGGWPTCCLGHFDHDWYAVGGAWEQLGQDVVYLPNADGDGIGDFAVGTWDDHVAIFSGGDPPTRSADLALGSNSGVSVAFQLAAGDFFNDGRTDLVVSEVRRGFVVPGWFGDHFVGLYRNSFNWQHYRTFYGAVIPPTYENSFGASIAVSRVVDAKSAIAFSSPTDDFYGPPKTKVSLRNAADVQISSDAGAPYDQLGLVVADVGDMNGDGRADLAALSRENFIRVYLGTTSGGGGDDPPNIGQ